MAGKKKKGGVLCSGCLKPFNSVGGVRIHLAWSDACRTANSPLKRVGTPLKRVGNGQPSPKTTVRARTNVVPCEMTPRPFEIPVFNRGATSEETPRPARTFEAAPAVFHQHSPIRPPSPPPILPQSPLAIHARYSPKQDNRRLMPVSTVCTEHHPAAAHVFGKGRNLFQEIFDNDGFAELRKENLFYPFKSKEEWGIAQWLSGLPISQANTDEFFRLEYVRFHLVCVIEMLTFAAFLED